MVPTTYKDNNMIATVKENCMGYTECQYTDAKRACKLYHILGAPTLENFKKILEGLQLKFLKVKHIPSMICFMA